MPECRPGRGATVDSDHNYCRQCGAGQAKPDRVFGFVLRLTVALAVILAVWILTSASFSWNLRHF